MKKRILFPLFFVMMCAAFINACFADAPKIKLYDFSEKNSTWVIGRPTFRRPK